MSSREPATRADVPEQDSDTSRLHQLGYAQELARHMSGFSNFAVSFTIISVLSGCLTLYGFGLNTGGPAVIVWGWPFVGLMTLFVGLAMAEVCSSFPTAGGLYYWSAKLAKKNAAAWSWFTGWFNFLGQVAVTAGIDFGAAFFLNAFLDLQFGFDARPWHTILLFGLILLLHGALNQFGVRWWHCSTTSASGGTSSGWPSSSWCSPSCRTTTSRRRSCSPSSSTTPGGSRASTSP
jgi:amino acid transporter